MSELNPTKLKILIKPFVVAAALALVYCSVIISFKEKKNGVNHSILSSPIFVAALAALAFMV